MTASDGAAPHQAAPSRAGVNAVPGSGDAPGEVVLRDMRWWDLAAVIALEHDLFPEDAWSRGMFWSELADTRHPAASRRYVVAEQAPSGRIVGYAGLAAVAGTADVQTIAAARDHWSTGLGARLLTELLRAATAAECHEVLLEVRVDNPRAQRLYRRFGFEPIGFRKGYYQPGNVDALVMRLADPASTMTAADAQDAQDLNPQDLESQGLESQGLDAEDPDAEDPQGADTEATDPAATDPHDVEEIHG